MTASETLLAQIIHDNDIFFKCELKEDDFVDPRQRRIFRAISKILESNQEVDIVAICDADSHIQPSYVSSLSYFTTSNWEIHANKVREESDLYKLRLLHMELHDHLERGDNPQDIRQNIEKRITEVDRGVKIRSIYEVMTDVISEVEKSYLNGGKLPGLSTGFRIIDDKLLGIQNGYYVIGARPSVGKTMFGLQLIMNLAKHTSCGIVSAEMRDVKLGKRSVANKGNIILNKLQTGLMKENEFKGFMDAVLRLADMPVYIADKANIPLSDLRSTIRAMVRRNNVRVVLVDYIGLITNETNRPRHEQMSEVSRVMKQISRDLDIAVIALSQVGRQTHGKPPCLADLRETGSIEQDADVVMFLHHERDDDDVIKYSFLDIAKNREGETGRIYMHFDPSHMRFSEIERNH